MSRNSLGFANHFYRTFGKRIKNRRRELKFTQVRLSELVGMSRTALANIEAGAQRTSVFSLMRMADALDISPDELIPNLSEVEAQLRQARKTPIPSKSRPELMIKELKSFNISAEPKSNMENALEETVSAKNYDKINKHNRRKP